MGGIVGGFLSGAVAARYQARGQVESMRVSVQGEFDQLKLEREIALEDKEQEAKLAGRREAEQVRAKLRRASLDLAAALRQPDAMQVNVRNAQRDVRAAAANVPLGSSLRPLVDQLVEASEQSDPHAVEEVASELSSSAD